MEAANQFVARTKTVDSSLLTMQNMQRASYAGVARFKTSTSPYYKGSPIVNPIIYDLSSCPQDHSYTDGYTSVTRQIQHEAIANENGGASICGDSDYSKSPQFIYLQNQSTCNTILTSYNNNVSFPSGPRGPPASAGLTTAYWTQVFNSSSGTNTKISNPLYYPPRYVFPKNLASLYFNGNSFLQLSQDTVYTWPLTSSINTTGQDDFTVDFFIKPSGSGGSTQTLFYLGAPAIADTYKLICNLISTGTSGGLNTKYAFQLQVSSSGIQQYAELLVDKWYHIVIMRYASSVIFYLNGELLIKIYVGAGIPNSSSTTNYLSGTESIATIGGKYNAGFTALANGFNGYLTNFRWIKGLGIYLLRLDETISLPDTIAKPGIPLDINRTGINSDPYVAVGLLAQSAATLLTNTKSPTATVTITDGNTINGTYTAVSWATV
jgi:hypothetical protein